MVKAKRFTLFTLILLVIMLAVGCGEKIPEGFTEEEYEKSKKVVEVIDGYLDADISSSDAIEKLNVLSEQLEMSENSDVQHIGSQASFASFYIRSIELDHHTDKEDLQHIKDARDEIKDTLDGKYN